MTLTEVCIVTGGTILEGTLPDQNKHCCIRDVEFILNGERGILTYPVGKGRTRTEARRDLAKTLSGSIAVKNVFSSNRIEIQLPVTIQAKL